MIVATKLNVLAMAVGPMIVTGIDFPKLTPSQQAAVIAHERGHIIHKHGWKRIWWLVSFQWRDLAHRCQIQELEADRHATVLGHGYSLIHFLHSIHTHESPLHPTPRERIRSIEKWLQTVKYSLPVDVTGTNA